MGSFKLKLVAYFSLISLLPLAAAFWGFDTVTERTETRRADAVLQVGVSAALAAYGDELTALERSAERVAGDPGFQRALARRDPRALRRVLARTPLLRAETPGGLHIGRRAAPSAEHHVRVVRGRSVLGRVVAALPLDEGLTERLRARSGLDPADRVVFAARGRVVAGGEHTGAPVRAPVSNPATIALGGTRFRALASSPLPRPKSARLVVLTPQARIDAAADSAQGRVFVALLGALLMITLLAYLEGRSIVRTLGRVVAAANALAGGRLDQRVPVRGRDEFAQLGRAFNRMADQLQARMRELEDERRRLRNATLRFGEALEATHDVTQLRRVIVETAMEATGARGGAIEGGEGPETRIGQLDDAPDRLELPLTAGRDSFGVLVLAGDRFTGEEREAAAWLVGHAVVALLNVRQHQVVQRQALVDPLTGLANRRLCEGALEQELTRAQRFGEPLALVLADLDDFKEINDRYGHPVGDEVLREFAVTLRQTLREIDMAGRWGGEEFALVLPGTDQAGGVRLAERIRAALADRVIAPDGSRIALTASFGVAAFPDATSVAALVAEADAALYEAKRNGKNRVAGALPVGVREPD